MGDLNVQGATFTVPLSKKTYSSSGFSQPMDDLPAVNSVKARSAVPDDYLPWAHLDSVHEAPHGAEIP